MIILLKKIINKKIKTILVSFFILSTSYLMEKEENNTLEGLTLPQRIKSYTLEESYKGLLWSSALSGAAGLTFLGIKRPKSIKTLLKTMPKTQTLLASGLFGLAYLPPQLYNWSTYTKIAQARSIRDIKKFLNKTDERSCDHTPSQRYYFQPNPLKILAHRLDVKPLTNNVLLDDIINILSAEEIEALLDFLTYEKKQTIEILDHLKQSINNKINALYKKTTVDEWILLFQLINKDTKNYNNNIDKIIEKINQDKIVIPSQQLAEHETVNQTELYRLPRTIYRVITNLNTKKAKDVSEKNLVHRDHINTEKTFSDFLFDVVVQRLSKGTEYWHLNDAAYAFSCFDQVNIDKNSESLKQEIANFKNNFKYMMLGSLYKDFSDKNNQMLILYYFNLNFLQNNYNGSQYRNNWYRDLLNLFIHEMPDDKYKNEKETFLASERVKIKQTIDRDTSLKNYLRNNSQHFENFYKLL